MNQKVKVFDPYQLDMEEIIEGWIEEEMDADEHLDSATNLTFRIVNEMKGYNTVAINIALQRCKKIINQALEETFRLEHGEKDDESASESS